MSESTAIHTDDAPGAIGPYNQAVYHGGLVYCSGQVALDPATMELVGEDVATQAEQVMKNLGNVLKAAGSSFDRAIKCTIYLRDMADFATVNGIYERSFPNFKPARVCIAASGLPKDALVEIDCIASVG